MTIRRTYYGPEWFLWHVTLDREEKTHRSPAVNVIAKSASEAEVEARQIMLETWKDESHGLRVLEVMALHPVHGMALPPAPPPPP